MLLFPFLWMCLDDFLEETMKAAANKTVESDRRRQRDFKTHLTENCPDHATCDRGGATAEFETVLDKEPALAHAEPRATKDF